MKKILIVDDEPNIVMTLEYAFKKQNFSVFIARDGSEAIEIAKKEIPDVVLLDIMMPKVDGYKTIEIIKKDKDLKNVKIVFLSAKSKTVDIEKGLSLGAEMYFTKPFSIKKIVAEINKLIN